MDGQRKVSLLRWAVLPRFGLIVISVLGLTRVVQNVRPNFAYLHLARSLLIDDRRYLEEVADQVSSALAVRPAPRRMWDETLMWFRLGRYSRAAEVLAALEPEQLEAHLRAKGMQPSWPLAYSVFSNRERYPVDWQWIVGSRPPAEYLILRGILAAQRGDFDEALQLYRLALAVAPQIYDGVFYDFYYDALAYSPDPADRQVANSVLHLLPDDLNIGSGVLVLDQYAVADASEYTAFLTEGVGKNLVGFEYDPAALTRGPLVPLRFAWNCGAEEEDGSGAQSRAQTWVQQVLAVNLIPNSGFEWNNPKEGVYPLGHERSFYHHDNLAHRSLLAEERNGALENVASIQRAPSTNESSFAPAPVRVRAGACYLHATWAKSLLGRGQMAIRWRDSRITERLSGQYAGIGPSDDWQLIAQVVCAPSEAVFADAFVGYQGTSVPHYFDDHLLVVLPHSPCVGENTLDDQQTHTTLDQH